MASNNYPQAKMIVTTTVTRLHDGVAARRLLLQAQNLFAFWLSISVQGRPCLNSHLGGTKSVLYGLASTFGSLPFYFMLVLQMEPSQAVSHTGL